MKKIFLMLFVLPVITFGEEAVDLKMDIADTAKEGKWMINKSASHPDASAAIKTDETGVPYVALRNHMHYHAKKLYRVTPADTVEIKLKVRGSGPFYAYYYVYDANMDWSNQAAYRDPFKQHVASFKTWTEINLKLPVMNPIVKGKQSYTSQIRPLLEIPGGVDVDIARFDVIIHTNNIANEWKIEQANSSGQLASTMDGISTNGTIAYCLEKFEEARAGVKLEVTLKVKGNGKLIVGYYAYNDKYNPKNKNNPPLPEILKASAIDSESLKEIKFLLDVKNIDQNSQKLYVTKIVPFFRLLPADGKTMELNSVHYKITQEQLSMPEF